jgi:hypothetical protein
MDSMSLDQPVPEEFPPVPVPPWWRFSLAELMFFMTVAALDFTFCAMEPAIGLGIAVVWVPAAIRTLAENRISQHAGIDPSLQEEVLFFIHSMLVVFTGFIFCGMIILVIMGTAAVLYKIAAFWIPQLSMGISSLIILGPYYVFAALLFLYMQFRFLKMSWPNGIRHKQQN